MYTTEHSKYLALLESCYQEAIKRRNAMGKNVPTITSLSCNAQLKTRSSFLGTL